MFEIGRRYRGADQGEMGLAGMIPRPQDACLESDISNFLCNLYVFFSVAGRILLDYSNKLFINCFSTIILLFQYDTISCPTTF